MAFVYVLRDAVGRHYIGATEKLEARLAQHRAGRTQTTRRMQPPIELVAQREFASVREALAAERAYKRWKNGAKVAAWINAG